MVVVVRFTTAIDTADLVEVDLIVTTATVIVVVIVTVIHLVAMGHLLLHTQITIRHLMEEVWIDSIRTGFSSSMV